MLHDLFLLSEYFEPPQSLTPEQTLLETYGTKALMTALSGGYIRQYSVPCGGGDCKNYYALSEQGVALIRSAYKHAT